MEFDIIFVVGELFFDHPLSGTAILKRFLEKNGFSVGIIEMPKNEFDVKKLGKPRLFFAVSSGSIDSMVRNYTPLKKLRIDDKNLNYNESVPNRAVIVYCNWIKKFFNDSKIIIGGVEASLRRFVHYDYWDDKLRKPILFDSRADILVFGCAEKQIVEIAKRLDKGQNLDMIDGTCIISKDVPSDFVVLPSFDEVSDSKEKFCDMQNLISNDKNLAQKIDTRFVVQFNSPKYISTDLDEYYELPFTRTTTSKHLRGFEFSVVTHRGCVGECNFCSLKLTQGNRIISRSEESILREIKSITKLPFFKGNIDDLGGPSANMYGMDCGKCGINSCIDCKKLDRSNKRLISLLKKARCVDGVKNVFVRSGVRFDLCSPEYLEEMIKHHIFDKLRVAPEHVDKNVLGLMNKDKGDLIKFLSEFDKLASRDKLCFYFMVAHPGCGLDEVEKLASTVKNLKNADSVQVFTPTPMTVSTCMYYTSLNPKTKQKVFVPYTFSEKKKQKRIVMESVGKKA